jgi:plastocyanin
LAPHVAVAVPAAVPVPAAVAAAVAVLVAVAAVLAVALAVLILGPAAASAATHTISTWQSPMTAVTIDAEVGDDVAWTGIPCCHTVHYLPSLDGMDLDIILDEPTICTSAAGGVRLDVGPSASVSLPQAGTFYYVCTTFFPVHCENGMRIRVNVTDSAVGVGAAVDDSAWGRVKALYR